LFLKSLAKLDFRRINIYVQFQNNPQAPLKIIVIISYYRSAISVAALTCTKILLSPNFKYIFILFSIQRVY